MSLLQIEKLTLRFGGLTAVKDVDLTIELGQVLAVIGPNGAGKTTVFNAISGIYEPTSGAILFHGQPLRKLFNTWLVVAAGVIGLLTAACFYLLAANPDALWNAAIRRPNNEAQRLRQPFSYSDAASRAVQYLRGGLVLEYAPRTVRVPLDPKRTSATAPRLTYGVPGYQIVSGDGSFAIRETISDASQQGELERAARSYELAVRADAKEDALRSLRDARDAIESQMAKDSHTAALEALEALGTGVSQQPSLRSAQSGSQWQIASEERVIVGLAFRSQAAAEDTIDYLIAYHAQSQSRAWYSIAAPLLGFILGVAATLALWSRSRRTPDVIARGGIARTFQNIRLFPNMTVLENVLVGMDRSFSAGLLSMATAWPSARGEQADRIHEADQLLSFMGLGERRNALAKNLPYGDQRRLEIARAMATKPELLLLDEPAAGMNPAESHDLMHLIRSIRDRGITILLIEHHMKIVMGISDRITVLEYGVKIAEGTPEEVRTNPRVIEAYLGKEEVH